MVQNDIELILSENEAMMIRVLQIFFKNDIFSYETHELQFLIRNTEELNKILLLDY